jgi:SAM-dependent methyltransferase
MNKQIKEKYWWSNWWCNPRGFFGENYIVGDNSREGYISGQMETLEERTNREAQGILNILEITEKNPIGFLLDAPCGYGRHSIALAKKFRDVHVVHGVDINEVHLQKAISDASKTIGRVNDDFKFGFYKRDLRDIDKLPMMGYGLKYDVVINMFFSFGFFLDENENVKMMQKFYDVLDYNNGKLLLHTDVCTEIIESGNYRLKEERHLELEKTLMISEKYDSSSKRLNGSWKIIDNFNNEVISNSQYSMRIYSEKEYFRMAKNCGFRDVKFYGSFDEEKFTPTSPELIMVATKY